MTIFNKLYLKINHIVRTNTQSTKEKRLKNNQKLCRIIFLNQNYYTNYNMIKTEVIYIDFKNNQIH